MVSTLLHETGYALHFYKTKENIPDDYKKIIEMAQTNPEVLRKVQDYSNELNRIYDEVEKVVIEKAKDLGLNKQTLKVLLSQSFTVDEYIKQQQRIFVKENVDAILRSEYSVFVVIGDILDAIYEGDLHTGVLKNAEGYIIKKTYGHGIPYYSNTDKGFKEMIANFALIVKAKDARENLALLKNIVGDEL